MTPYQLWQIKTGRAPQPEVTAAMAHGTQLEPAAREAYEQHTGLVMEPLVLVDGEYSASLDGITLGRRADPGDQVPEVEGLEDPGRGQGRARAGALYWQMQTS